MTKIYIAMGITEYEIARDWADRFRFHGFEVTSKWHDIVDGSPDPHNREIRTRILNENIGDLEAAQILFADTRTGVPSATFGEIAWALASAIPVAWLQPPGRRADGVRHNNIFDSHMLCRVFVDPLDVPPALQALSEAA